MERTVLKQNTVVFFDNLTHTYINDGGKYLIGVTELMKRHGLSPDYSNVNPDVLARKAEYGSAVHKGIERYIKADENDGSPELEAYMDARIDALASEYLVSDNETVATSIDIVTSELDLIDIKTTSVLHTDALRWQLSIGAYLFEMQNPGLKVRGLYGLHIKGKDGRFKAELVKVERLDDGQVSELISCEREGRTFYPPLPAAMENDEALRKLYDLEMLIADIEAKAKEAKAQRDEMTAAIYSKMEAGNLKKIETDRMVITRVLPSVRTTVDAKALQTGWPQVYEEVRRETQTKGSVRIKIK